MEQPPRFESREAQIDTLIERLAAAEGMSADDIRSDIAIFAPVEGSTSVNTDYLAEVAEKLGISIEEMHAYARAKAAE